MKGSKVGKRGKGGRGRPPYANSWIRPCGRHVLEGVGDTLFQAFIIKRWLILSIVERCGV